MTESTLQRFRSAHLGSLPLLIAVGILAAPTSSEAQVSFKEHVISTTAGGVNWIVTADVDGDGDADVLSADLAADTIAWYESDGASPPSFTKWIISTSADGATGVFAADVDGDGDIDALSSSAFDDTIAWYESDGGLPPTFTERIISTTAAGAQSVFAADVDGDGDTDVLSAEGATIAWYENDGASPPGFSERVVSTSAVGAFQVFAADVDGDGDTDVLSAWGAGDSIAWHESDGASPPSFTQWIISTAVDRPRDVFTADVDGDGDTDVLSASEWDDKIAWYENDGASPPGFTERVISTSADGATSVFTADFDGDGDTDVLSASWLDDKIAWYESDGGSPPGFTEWVISTSANGATCALAADVDGDGETDVVSASHLDHKVAWYENLGLGCVFELGVASAEVRAAEALRARVHIEHNGSTKVRVPVHLWIVDGAGSVVASKTTRRMTLRPGEPVELNTRLRVPNGTPPGVYYLMGGVKQMRRGAAGGGVAFEVVQ